MPPLVLLDDDGGSHSLAFLERLRFLGDTFSMSAAATSCFLLVEFEVELNTREKNIFINKKIYLFHLIFFLYQGNS